MQGQQEYQPKLFSIFNMEELIPENHLLRKIDKTLDLGFVREATADLYCQANGRPSVDPELFIRMCLLTYLYNIPSDRQLCEEVQFNLAYRWYCRLSLEDQVPDHSSMTRARDRLGEKIFKEIFDHVVRICIEKGLVKCDKLMMDGTFVKADAATSSRVARESIEESSGEGSVSNIKAPKFSNETHVSQTDPESTMAGKEGEMKQLRYKVHDAIDRDSRIVVDTHVTTGIEHEGKVMSERLDHIEATFSVHVEELTADRGYGYGVNLNELEKRGIDSLVPNFHKDVGDNIDPEIFKYDAGRDLFTCPQGHFLERKSSDETEKKDYARRYQIRGANCAKCPMMTTCYEKPPQNTSARKAFVRNVFWELQFKTKEREKTQAFRLARSERQWKMEGIFAEAKNNHGLKRARYRGKSKMQIQAYMIATVQNLKRMACELPAVVVSFQQYAAGVAAGLKNHFPTRFWTRIIRNIQTFCPVY